MRKQTVPYPPPARGKYLSRIARLHGMRRRLFESDEKLRQRIIQKVLGGKQ